MEIRVYAPAATAVSVEVDGQIQQLVRDTVHPDRPWVGEVAEGARYALYADGPASQRFDARRALVDPRATAVWFPSGHRRDAACPGRYAGPGESPVAVTQPWPDRRPQRRTTRPLVVYESHIRGLTQGRVRSDRGTFSAAIEELDRLATLGVSVIELLPVHQFDPDETNYWGYMPLVFGAVHGSYSAGDDAAAELADLVDGAHDRDIEVWLDVVFNHTTEEDVDGPTYNLRGLADREYYVVRPDGSYVDEAGTGNIVDASSPAAQALVMEALDRFADLGVDGFRFDLAAVLARDIEFVRGIGDWAVERGVRLVAEPWDLARYMLGRSFPDDRWMQWNDRFRDDMRGFLRGEPGLVSAVMRRIEGSPDLFDEPMRSVNFFTAHDGFTLYDLVSYDRKYNDANGWNNTDGTDDNRSWNCGWEGDADVPELVAQLRRRQLRNAMCLLLLSHGVPQFVAGDEFGRTQGGNNNPYNQDNDVSWIDWDRRQQFLDLEEFVASLIALRRRVPLLSEPAWWGDRVEWFGVDGGPDESSESRSLAWSVGGLYVIANMWWEPLTFAVQALGPWTLRVDTALDQAVVDIPLSGPVRPDVNVGARSIVVLERTEENSAVEAEAHPIE